MPTYASSQGVACFNSRTREGCDLVFTPANLAGFMFQFTHPGGVRQASSLDELANIFRFNSRTREGCDRYR